VHGNFSSLTGSGLLILQIMGSHAPSLRAGEAVKAEVVSADTERNASIRVQGMVLPVTTELPVQRGDIFSLLVERQEDILYLRLAGTPEWTSGNSVKSPLLPVLERLRELRPAADALERLVDLLVQMPVQLRRSLPEIETMTRFLVPVDRLSARSLKDTVQQGGAFFETKLRILALGMEADGTDANIEARRIIAGDLKAGVLRLKDTMLQEGFFDALAARGVRPADLLDAVNSVLRNIEFYQLKSKLTESLQFFLPLLWKELKDGELVLHAADRGTRDSRAFSCVINLHLEGIGRTQFNLLLKRGSLQVLGAVESSRFCNLLQENAAIFQKELESTGLHVAGLDFRQEKAIDFGERRAAGLTIRVEKEGRARS
jgi:hypothetical protein